MTSATESGPTHSAHPFPSHKECVLKVQPLR